MHVLVTGPMSQTKVKRNGKTGCMLKIFRQAIDGLNQSENFQFLSGQSARIEVQVTEDWKAKLYQVTNK
jgi:hypothetical protein